MDTITSPHEVKASKEHQCNFCTEKIRVGEKYETSVHKCDGQIYPWKTHKHCSKIAIRLKMYDECDEGLTGDMFQETIHCVHDDIMIGMLPTDDKYNDVKQQLRHVRFRDKLFYVIRYFSNIDKEPATT